MEGEIHANQVNAEEAINLKGYLNVKGKTTLGKRLEVNEDVEIGEAEQAPGLETYGYGIAAETSIITFKETTIGNETIPPFCYGAGCYKAVNNDVQGGNTLEVGFATETSRSAGDPPAQTFHQNDDIMGGFVSYAHNGPNEDPALVGGIATQAAGNHALNNLPTKLLLMYTPPNSAEFNVGALLDESGCFHALKDFWHNAPNGKLGFFGADLTDQQPVNLYSLETKVDSLIDALKKLGLIKTVTIEPEGEPEGEQEGEQEGDL